MLIYSPQEGATRRNYGRVQPEDVVCDRRDPRCALHRGNQEFAVLLARQINANESTRDLLVTEERLPLATNIVQEIRTNGGRFLGRTKRGTLKDVGDELAVRWTSLAIRRAVENSRDGSVWDGP